MKPQPEADGDYLIWKDRRGLLSGAPKDDAGWWFSGPYGRPGDRLWVKETWATTGNWDHLKPSQLSSVWGDVIVYKASEPYTCYHKWRSSRFMPKWVSRIKLDIIDVRVERLQQISEANAIAEGIELNCVGDWQNCPGCRFQKQCRAPGEYRHYLRKRDDAPAYSTVESFQSLWDSINAGSGFGWRENPFVWVIEFKRVKP
jgi:hypothetical protein